MLFRLFNYLIIAVAGWCISFSPLLAKLVFLNLEAGLGLFGRGFFNAIRTLDVCIVPIPVCGTDLDFDVLLIARVPLMI
jgi:hypothetical protein